MYRIYSVDEFINEFDEWNCNWYNKRKNRQVISYFGDVMTFDTEFTSIPFEHEYFNTRVTADGSKRQVSVSHFGLLYLWQCCFRGVVIMGRTMDEYVRFVAHVAERLKLGAKRRIACYVHNLECDFNYLKGWFENWDIFATAKRAVLTAYVAGIEYRCSFKLTNMSLAKFLESEGVATQKQSGDEYDYGKLRTPDTPLSAAELFYAYCDVKGLYEAIKSKMEKNGDNVATIPLTSTGYVRRDCRSAVQANYKNWDKFQKLKLNAEQYDMFVDAFRGGNTHANRFVVGRQLHGLKSYDIASSYPSAMLYYKYPAGPCIRSYASTFSDLDAISDRGYGYIVSITFTNLRTTKAYIPYVPVDKCDFESLDIVIGGYVMNDNGRVLYAGGETTMTILDVDLRIIRDQYEFDDVRINKCFYYQMAPLPLELRQTISEYFTKKTELKGIDGMEYFYSKIKNMFNGIYGMTVMALIHELVFYDKGVWSTKEKEDHDGELRKYYHSKNNFLAYQWGVYVTAYARRRLQEAIDICGPYMVYCDTDSVKFKDNPEICRRIEAINDRIIKIANNCETGATAKNKKGELQVLGVWDKDAEYKTFKTFGAKKYADVRETPAGTKVTRKREIDPEYEDVSILYHGKIIDGKIRHRRYDYYDEVLAVPEEHFEITVSGLSKRAAKEFGCIDCFETGVVIQDSGRTISIYDDNVEPHFETVDGKQYELRGSMAIVDTTYRLGISEVYEALIEGTDKEETVSHRGKKITYVSSMKYDCETE